MIRLAHFSDIHFNLPSHQVAWRELAHAKRLLGWLGMRASRYRRLAGARTIAAALQADIAQQQLAGVVFTGDMTCLGLPGEFEQARQALEPLRQRQDVVGIPGNHDAYVDEAVGAFERYFPGWLRSDLPHRGWPSPFVRFFGDVALVGLESSRPNLPHDSSGEVPKQALWQLDSLLDHPELRARHVVLALHYGLLRPSGAPDHRLHGLRNADALMQLLPGRVALVIHGHMHRRFMLPLGNGSWVGCAGSVSDTKRSQAYHLLEFEDGVLRLEARRYNSTLQAFEAWPDAPHAGSFPLLER